MCSRIRQTWPKTVLFVFSQPARDGNTGSDGASDERDIMAVKQRKAVFLDKDGTLIRDVPYNVDPGKIRMAPGAYEALRLLHARGYLLVVVSNQSGVARGFFSEKALLAVRKKLIDIFVRSGVPLAGFYYCPHPPDGVIRDTGPNASVASLTPGFSFGPRRISTSTFAFHGWSATSLTTSRPDKMAGCRTVLIVNGNETKWEFSQVRGPTTTRRTWPRQQGYRLCSCESTSA